MNMVSLKEAILEYTSAKEAFENCPDMIQSRMIPPKSQKIADRYFKARGELEDVCKVSDNSLAQEYYTKSQLAHECAKMMCDREVNRSDECVRRMTEYYDVKRRLLEK